MLLRTLDVDDGTKPVFMDLNGAQPILSNPSAYASFVSTLFKYVAPKLLLKLEGERKVLEEGTELFTIGKHIEFPNVCKAGAIRTFVHTPAHYRKQSNRPHQLKRKLDEIPIGQQRPSAFHALDLENDLGAA